MARSQKQKAESRQAIMRSAAKLFREKGFEGVTVAEVMDGAGLTHGGFPRHFSSKEELISATLGELFAADARAPSLPSDDLRAFVRAYLRPEHRRAPGSGCVFAALGPEMARAPGTTREVLTEAIERQIDTFTSIAGDADAEKRRVTAIGTWATMIGAMVLARIVNSEALSDEILASARDFLEIDG
ncbi:TetR/AcrR family transcriptional regulator [Ancylobacter sp. WKF20]|uniref:TetR/AcrR family transcriptional regulator n=1 Tax=Ancylobacter sp. WKF20 TaxID=3039801 RepID=UPI00243417AA|nr:TetR/AcrR family transcriptional regulator [Ancylobacter sp. WKF20]WGD32230.1 TetR/AcrR family transcriptional regulator [Ancylobacter sp. WKF20]